MAVVPPDTIGRHFECFALRGVKRSHRRLQGMRRQFERRRIPQIKPIEPSGVVKQRRIATHAQIGQNRRYGLFDFGVSRRLKRQPRGELRLEIPVSGIELKNHASSPAAPGPPSSRRSLSATAAASRLSKGSSAAARVFIEA